MGKLLSILFKLLLIAGLAVLTLGFGGLGLCGALADHGSNALLGLALLGVAVLLGRGIFKLAGSIWRQIKGPKA